MKKIAILQSNYIPWRGYFDLINYVDEFIFFDEVQYTKRDWRNRNLIRNEQKKFWVTIPIKNMGHCLSKILDIKIFDNQWNKKHLNIFKENYKRAEYFIEIYSFLEKILNNDESYLYKINRKIIIEICKYIKINTKFNFSEDIPVKLKDINASLRLVEICKQQDASIYVTGPAGREYLDQDLFVKENIKIEFFNYKHCKQYNQMNYNFIPALSIVDCLFNCGTNKDRYLNC